jgi:ParB/RepB/Spo0J family partition protein
MHDDFYPHDDESSEHSPVAAPTIQFRCTFCQAIIPWQISKQEVGLKPEEEFQGDTMYSYEKCNCGWSKFILCQKAGDELSPARPTAKPDGTVRSVVENAKYGKIPVDQIDPNPYQPRKFFDAEALRSLSESIQSVGLLEDIVLRPVGDRYQIILGERRWRACTLAGCQTINAKIVELDDDAVRVISITENIHREDLTKVEEAFAFKEYVDEGKQLSEVGQLLGRMGDRVAERLKILNTHNYIQYQEERIVSLQEMVDHLRTQIDHDSDNSVKSLVVGVGDVTKYLNQGYDIVAALDADHIIIRYKPAS